jgi:hypothetical protein
MFLNRRLTFIFISFTLLPSFALGASTTQSLKGLETGSYKRVKGSKQFCPDFKIVAADLKGGKLRVSAQQSFALKESTVEMKSDLDENCVFREQNIKEESIDQTILIRSDTEICESRVKSEEVVKLVIRPGVIQLESKVTSEDMTSVESCEWSLIKN